MKSKFYLKKSEDKVRHLISEFRETVEKIGDNQVITIRLDGLPENYPLSFIYDLVEYTGGCYSDLEDVTVDD